MTTTLSYAEEKAERKQRNLRLFGAIAEVLNAKRVEMKGENDAIVTRLNGRKFFIEHNEREQKLHVSGYYFYDDNDLRKSLIPFKPHGATTPSINVSALKDPDKVASDINRRFLDEYDSLMDQMLKRKADSDAYEAAQQTSSFA